MRNKNFGLSEDEFNNLTIQLKKGKEEIFERIFLSQFETNMSHLIIKYKAPREDAYDVCMDSLIYFRKLLLTDKVHYGNLKALFNQVTSQKYIKHINKKKKVLLRGAFSDIQPEDAHDQEDSLASLNKAWNRLGHECKEILKDYYYNEHKLYEIAESLEKSPAAIRKQKERCINTLRINFR